MINNTPVLPNFISNTSDGEDLFEAKAQKRIASSISSLINKSTSGFRILGLEGPWGAGKSNVINIIGKELKDSVNLFVYDAWGHQEDLQRRTFLEELTEFLCANHLVDKKVWSKKLKELLAKKQESVTKTVPKLSSGIIVALIITFLSPFVKSLTDIVENNNLKIALGFTPILIAIVFLLLKYILSSQKFTLADVFYIYKERELENISEVITSTREPSVREFKKWMLELSESLEKKLIVVFDNMDRLPAAKVQTLWSSINTFFSDNNYDNIWVIIPFDRDHIGETFSNKPQDIDQFIDKTFPVVYRVAQPVFTDWQHFFNIKYKEAFGISEADQYMIVKNCYDLMKPSITPRDIISFLNELVASKHIYGAEIQLSHMAIFALSKRDILKNPVDQILGLEFLGASASIFKETNLLQNAVAALTYNINVESATQVIFQREIKSVIKENDLRRFRELSKYQHFSKLLEQFSFSNLAGVDINLFVNCLKNLNEDWVKDSEYNETRLWDRLSDVYTSVVLSTQSFNETQKIFLTKCSHACKTKLVSYLLQGYKTIPEFKGGNYFKAISGLEKFCAEHYPDLPIKSTLSEIEMSPFDFLDYLEEVAEWEDSYRVICDQNKLNDYVIEKINENAPVNSSLGKVKTKFDLTPITKHLIEQIEKNTISADNLENIYNLYKAVNNSGLLIKPKDSDLITLFRNIPEGSDAYCELIAMRVSRGQQYVVNTLAAPYLNYTIEKNNDYIEKIAQSLEYYLNYGDLLLYFDKYNNSLVRSLVQKLTHKAYQFSVLDIKEVLGNYTAITEHFDIHVETFFARLEPWASKVDESITEDNINDIIHDDVFYRDAVQYYNSISKKLIGIFIKSLNSISIEEWETAFASESYLSTKTALLARENYLTTLPKNMISAIKNTLINYANKIVVIEDTKSFSRYCSKINKLTLKTTFKNIRDIFINTTDIGEEQGLILFGSLIEYGELEARAADVVRRIFTPMLKYSSNLTLFGLYSRGSLLVVQKAGNEAIDFKAKLKEITIFEHDLAFKAFVKLALGKPVKRKHQ
nr:P-loop NTPase fold protein [uncultured Mucilaginibacter sp.]